MHVRPMLDLRNQRDVAYMLQMMHDISDLVASYGGALSGEHGDGLVRSWLNEKMFGPEIYHAFKRIKQAFDPNHIMNPGKIINGPQPTENLRIGPHLRPVEKHTGLDFSQQGGLFSAVTKCNNVAACRKVTGAMCPSFQVTGDERETTRARAQSLFAYLTENIDLQNSDGTGLYDIFDLCLECKSCKQECPAQVDMAQLKAEFLFQFYKVRRVPLRNWLFGMIDSINKLGCLTYPLSNFLLQNQFSKYLAAAIGITPKRHFPRFTQQRFSKWFYSQPKQTKISKNPTENRVVY